MKNKIAIATVIVLGGCAAFASPTNKTDNLVLSMQKAWSACASPYLENNVDYAISHNLYSKAANCYATKIKETERAMLYGNNSLVEIYLTDVEEIAHQIEARQTTVADGEQQVRAAATELISTLRQRDAQTEQQAAANAPALLGAGALLLQQSRPPVLPRPTVTNCQTYINGANCMTY